MMYKLPTRVAYRILEHMVQDSFFPSITTDSGQRFLLICTKSLDQSPQPSALGQQCMKMSAERTELKTYLWKGFEASITMGKTR